MLEGMLGRLVNGALWGLGAGLALSVTRSEGGLRPVTKALLKAYIVAADRIQEVVAEARESLDDLYAEARAEQEAARRRPSGNGVRHIPVTRSEAGEEG